MKAFNRFYRKLIVISVLYEIFRCSNVHFTPVQTQNVVHTICSAETSTAARNSQPFPRYGQKLIVISVLFEIFRRLNLHFIPFQTQNVVHTICSAEKRPAHRNQPTFTRFLRKLIVISVLYEILRRLNAHFTPFQTQNVVHTICSAETSPATRNSPTFTRFYRYLLVISVLFELFRRLKVHFTPFQTLNVVHTIYSAETSPADR